MRHYIMLIGILCLCTNCSTLNSVLKAKEDGKGTVVDYPVNFEDGWEIAKRAFRWAGADAIEEYKDEGYMLTSKGMNLVSSGSVMGSWVEDLGNGQCRVTVISKRRISTQIATGMTEDKYHRLYAKGVEIVKSGQPLPATAPDMD